MIKMIVIMFISILMANISHAHISRDSHCEITGAVRCLCPASMSVSCNGNAGTVKGQGYIKNEEVVKFAFLKIRDKTTGAVKELSVSGDDLKELDARSFYGINSNSDFRNKFNIKDREEIDVQYIELNPSLKLYSDSNAKNDAQESKLSTSSNSCTFVEDAPVIASYPGSCGGKKVCIARIKCANEAVGFAACPVKLDGNCPSATDCAADELIQLEANHSGDPVIKSNSDVGTNIGK